ncbi:MAG: hypothetical protein WC464_04480 [Bdellovibrionales bacterium]
MSFRRFLSLIAVMSAAALLTGCVGGTFHRDDIAAKAKTRMIGMAKEDVLTCMGIPKKKMAEGATEVWSYHSTDGYSTTPDDTLKVTSYYSHKDRSHQKKFCTVNVVMKSGAVKAIHYLGPTGTTFLNDYDQCGYAVAACVEE